MVLAENHRVQDKLENALGEFFGFIPELIAAIAILIVGYFIAKLIGNVVSRLLYRGGLDRAMQGSQGGNWVARLTSSPSHLIGRGAFWALFLGVIALAVSVLGINALTDFVGTIFGYLPNVLAALAIFLVAGAIAAGVAALIGRTMGETPTGKVLATVAPGLVMAIAIFMILDQLKIAETIVTITYVALVGSLALAAALAFGLGGRDVAARMLAGAYQKGQENKDQVRQDLAQGKERAREDADRAREAVRDRAEGDEGPDLVRPGAAEAVGASGGGTRGATTGTTPAGTAGGWDTSRAGSEGVTETLTARPSEAAVTTTPGATGTSAGTTPGGVTTGDVGDVEVVGRDEPDVVPPGSAEEADRPRR